jgi:hypothetical protein
MKPTQTIYIQLEDAKGQPLQLSGVLVEIHFFTKGNHRYTFVAGFTNETGAVRISYFDVEKLRSDGAKFFLMDYNTKLEECDPTVRINIPTDGQLRDAFENASRAFNKPPEWSIVWPSNGRIEALPREVEPVGPTTELRLTCKWH